MALTDQVDQQPLQTPSPRCEIVREGSIPLPICMGSGAANAERAARQHLSKLPGESD